MLLIPDNTTLRSFIPNSFSTLPDQPSLFDKITPFLQSAEIWFCSEFIPVRILGNMIELAQSQEDPRYFLPRRIVALRAWQTALPAIDIVIGTNGAGVVETNNLKPASKAKIDNLMQSVAEELDRNIGLLLLLLPKIDGWINTGQADKFKATLFPSFHILDCLGYRTDLWNKWLHVSQRIHTIEDEIGDRWISMPVLNRIRIINIGIMDGRQQPVAHEILELISRVKAAVRIVLSSNNGPGTLVLAAKPYLEEANAIIRNNPGIFPEWNDSPTARFFKTPAFRNRPDSTAYFF